MEIESEQSTEVQSNGVLNNEQPIKPYPAAELVLTTIQREYDLEESRARTLDSRVGIFIPLSSAILVFIASYIKIPNSSNIAVHTVLDALPYVLALLLGALSILCFLIATFYFVRVVSKHKYNRINLEGFNDDAMLALSKDFVAVGLIEIYKKNIEHNVSVNDRKMSFYQIGVYLISSALVLAIIVYLIDISFLRI
jgi:hypothetical protein